MTKYEFYHYGLNTHNQVKYLRALTNYWWCSTSFPIIDEEDGEEYGTCLTAKGERKVSYFLTRAEEVARSWQSRQRNDNMDVYRHYKHSSSTAEVF